MVYSCKICKEFHASVPFSTDSKEEMLSHLMILHDLDPKKPLHKTNRKKRKAFLEQE